MSKPHWTQTPEGRKRMADIMRARKRAERKSRAASHRESKHDEHEADPAIVAFAVGHTQAWLTAYADSVGLPSANVTARVGELLHRSARGKVLGS